MSDSLWYLFIVTVIFGLITFIIGYSSGEKEGFKRGRQQGFSAGERVGYRKGYTASTQDIQNEMKLISLNDYTSRRYRQEDEIVENMQQNRR